MAIGLVLDFLGLPEVVHGLGVVDRKNNIPAGWEDTVRSRVKEINWSTIEPNTSGVFNFSAIDSFLADCANTGHVGVLRVMAGWYAPTFVKNACGVVTIFDPVDGGTGTIPMYATAAGRATLVHEWQVLQAALADAYDSVPQMGVVCIPGFGPYAEPAVQQLSYAPNRTNLLNAGYVRAEAEQCLRDMSDAMAAEWATTRVYLPGNPWQFINNNGGIGTDTPTMNTLLDYHRAALGVRGEVGNNSIRDAATTNDPLPANYTPLYDHIEAMGSPIGFQTSTAVKIGDLDATITWAISVGAARVELPTGYENLVTEARMAQLDAGLRANG